MNLKRALATLDPAVDEHWTADGLPRMDVIAELTGDNTIARAHVTSEAPQLTRETAPEIVHPSANTANDTTNSANQDDELAEDEEWVTEDEDVPEEEPVPERTLTGTALDRIPEGASVLDIRATDVMADADLTQAALGEIEQKVLEAHRAKAEIEDDLKQLNAKCEILKRAAIQHSRRSKRGGQTTAVQDYLAAQKTARAERAERARMFLRAGTTAADVADQIQGASRLDTAMNRRKAALGATRPPVRPAMNTA